MINFNGIPSKAKQKIVGIVKEPCDKQHPYGMINIEALRLAMIDLRSGGAFKLWTYLAKNQDNYAFAMGNAEMKEHWGMSKDQYDAAVATLIKKHYLVPRYKGKTKCYYFFEIARPDLDEVEVQKQENTTLESADRKWEKTTFRD